MKVFAFDMRPSLVILVEYFLTDKTDFRRIEICKYIERTEKKVNVSKSSGTPGRLRDDEKRHILNLLALLLISPSYTYTIVHLFRPLIIDIVSRLNEFESELLEFLRKGREGASKQILKISYFEIVCEAYSKILPLFPQCLEYILSFLQRQPSLLDHLNTPSLELIKSESGLQRRKRKYGEEAEISTESNPHQRLITILSTSFRFLHYSPTCFTKLWSWVPLFHLLEHEDTDVRCLARECVSLVSGLQDTSQASSLQRKSRITSSAGLLKSIMCREEQERASLFVQSRPAVSTWEEVDLRGGVTEAQESYGAISNDERTGGAITVTDRHLVRGTVVDVCGVILYNKINAALSAEKSEEDGTEGRAHPALQSSTLVYTPTAEKNMRSLALAVRQRNPVLLEGVAGSGKTALVTELARLTGNHDIVRIHLGDEADPKMLLGTYVCTETPGEFRWQPGALTQAVESGRWIIIEDMDLASADVASMLLPLLESRKLCLTSRGEEIECHPEFMLFGTCTVQVDRSGNVVSSGSRALYMLDNYWTHITVEPLQQEELCTVLEHNFASSAVSQLAEQFVATYFHVKRRMEDRSVLGARGRGLTGRDLMKWCKRVQSLGYGSAVRDSQQFKDWKSLGALSTKLRETIFEEAMDCFCGSLWPFDYRVESAGYIGDYWSVSLDRVGYYCDAYKPQVERTGTSLGIGRVSLSVKKDHTLTTRKGKVFAPTSVSLRLLEKLAVCVRMNEPVLLVGETGAGKTSTVQHLADELGQELVVLNMNQQSESSDMLGGFKPVNVVNLGKISFILFLNSFLPSFLSLSFLLFHSLSFLSFIQFSFLSIFI